MGLLDYADAAGRKFFGLLSQAPDNAKQMALAAYQLATDPNARQAAMSRLPKAFDESKSGRQMFDEAMNVGPSGLLGKIVWHGSPHKFDKFDASKIGTGEGAQAYGHGLYLADAPEVGSGYARGLGKAEIDGAPIRFDDPMQVAAHEVHLQGGDIAKAADRLYRAAQHRTHSAPPSIAKKASEILDGLIENKSLSKAQKINSLPKVEQGVLYKADLPDEWIPKMLDWDKPVSQQPEISDLLKMRVIKETEPSDSKFLVEFSNGVKTGFRTKKEARAFVENASGGDVIRYMSPTKGTQYTKDLSAMGIPGIRYLDGGSRSAGQGSYNYVVFPGLEDQVKILERNGIPLQGLLK